jgi:hypothetical protein
MSMTGMFGSVGKASPHNPKIQGSSPSFVTGGPTPLSPQRYQSCQVAPVVCCCSNGGSFLAREILNGCYEQWNFNRMPSEIWCPAIWYLPMWLLQLSLSFQAIPCVVQVGTIRFLSWIGIIWIHLWLCQSDPKGLTCFGIIGEEVDKLADLTIAWKPVESRLVWCEC